MAAAATAKPRFELVSGYTKITLTPSLTRVSVAHRDRQHRELLAAAALAIREELEKRGSMTRRLAGEPNVSRDRTVSIVMTDRSNQRSYEITVPLHRIADNLCNFAIKKHISGRPSSRVPCSSSVKRGSMCLRSDER